MIFVDVFATISEAFHDLFECFSTVRGEEVVPQHIRFINKSDVSEETSFALGAFERVDGDVDELLIFVK